MPKIDVTKTELVWPGKYEEDGTLKEIPRVSLPFQVIETVNESRATREAKKGGVQTSLFDVYEGNEGDTFEEGWKNKLIWGDNLLVMGSLLEKFAGKIDLIYIDPPLATGAYFSFTTEIGDGNIRLDKEALMVSPCYQGNGRYLEVHPGEPGGLPPGLRHSSSACGHPHGKSHVPGTRRERRHHVTRRVSSSPR